MKSGLLTLLVVLFVTPMFAADDTGQTIGGVDAVLHEGVVTFTVRHQEAVSASVRVYDLDSDDLIFDSGPRPQTRVNWPAGHDYEGGFRYLVTAWNAEGEVVVSQTAANKRQTPISEISFDTVPGNTSVVGPGEIDLLGDVNVGAVPGVGLYQDYGGLGYGGGVVVYGDSTFDKRVYMSADSATGAGYFRLNGPVGGFWIDGSQHLHGNEPAMSFYGGTSEFQFFAGETGTDSVVMPDDAVSATEIENEPGVAAAFATNDVPLQASPSINAVTTSITIPTNGYIFATGFVNGFAVHTQGWSSIFSCSISETQGVMYEDGEVYVEVSGSSPSGYYIFPISLSRILPAPSGTHQIQIVCRRSASSDISIRNRRLDLLFVPTAYGTVATKSSESGSAITGKPLTDADAENAEAIAFNLARIQSELDAIQAQADALAAEVDQ